MPTRTYRVPAKPKNDDEHLQLIARILFVMGFKYEIVEQRWPKIKKAFKNFSIEKIRKMKVEDIVDAEGMIRNKIKIQRVIDNANECHAIIKEYGSMQNWVKTIVKANKNDIIFKPTLADEAKRRFIGIGNTTKEWIAYVFAEGKSKPEMKTVELDH